MQSLIILKNSIVKNVEFKDICMINFDKSAQRFHIKNNFISYVIDVARERYLFHRYFGKALKEFRDSAPLQQIDRGFSGQPAAYENERTFSLDVLPQEYSTSNHSDFRIPAYEIELENGTTVTEVFYDSFEIFKGKKAFTALPSTYATEDEAETLEICLKDSNGLFEIFLTYTIFKNLPVITRSVKFHNLSSQKLKLKTAKSMLIDFQNHDFDTLSLYGGHSAERSLERKALARGIFEISSTRGASSHQQSPFIALARPQTTENSGEIYGFSLIYSGSFSAQVEVEQFGSTRLTMGLNSKVFSWLLENDDTFQCPEVAMVYSENGINGMSKTYHKLYRNHLIRGKFKEHLRPILVNNWEATYFDFNEDKILELADCAKDLGIELLVLDDGWFGNRNDDNAGLGDWVVNSQKLPNGLKSLAEKVKSKGLKFGLWFEPEMVNVESDLYKNHPDWILQVPNYPSTFSRHQLVLDLSRQDVCDYIIKAVSKILKEVPIDYVKWDMNRHMAESFSNLLPPERQLETQHRYMLGLYGILEKISQDFPDVLFESCSGGGGRFDAGILYYMPQTWTSDNTDAVSRLSIQTGTSYVFPPIAMGSHISVVPNHQMGRITPMQMRAFVAMAGDFGYELDICKMPDKDKELVKQHIKLFKEIRPTIQLGSFSRLISPFEGNHNETAWQFVSQDKQQIVVMYFKVLSEFAHNLKVLKLRDLEPDAEYQIKTYIPAQKLAYEFGVATDENAYENKRFYGDELMYNGLIVEKIECDFASYMWVIEKV